MGHTAVKRLPADERRHFCYTSVVKVASNFCYTSALKVPSSSIKLQKAFSVRRELLRGFARDLRESANARPKSDHSCVTFSLGKSGQVHTPDKIIQRAFGLRHREAALLINENPRKPKIPDLAILLQL